MKLEMPEFQDARLLVIGDVMLDRYWHGAASRVSPEAPVPVVRVGNREDRPGGAGNVALNVAALGSAARLIGVVGDDEAGEELRSRLSAAGVYCDFLQSDDKPTVTKLRVISQHQQLIRLDFEQMLEAKNLGDDGIDLVMKLLLYDPSKRITAQEARKHVYFDDLPEQVKMIGSF